METVDDFNYVIVHFRNLNQKEGLGTFYILFY